MEVACLVSVVLVAVVHGLGTRKGVRIVDEVVAPDAFWDGGSKEEVVWEQSGLPQLDVCGNPDVVGADGFFPIPVTFVVECDGLGSCFEVRLIPLWESR